MIPCRPKTHKAQRIASFPSPNTACFSLPLALHPKNETIKQAMDQNDNLMKVQNVHKINSKNSHFVIRLLKFVISISLLSFVVCYSSGYSLFPYSFNLCFSTMLFSILTRTLERKFMFLVCNGILAFLAKSACSSTSSSPSGSDLDGDDEFFRKQDRSALDNLTEDEIKVSTSGSSVEVVTVEDAATPGYNKYQDNLVLAAEEEEEGEEEKLLVQGKDTEEEDEAERQGERLLQETEYANTGAAEEGENETWVVEDDDRLSKEEEEEEEVEEYGYMRKETESPAVATGSEEMMSTEELNKKIEEFIRKMKEEIRIEAKSQLIAV
ncbi:hypothetical protein BT93_D0894 [Corymbia citriodora subsp. variegata]|nr:hypothetical protein BT93_D0894 [Corymbia citriodora subsp. variegata]